MNAFGLKIWESEQPLTDRVDCYIYVGQPAFTSGSDPRLPILQSYIDAVMQGFLDKFGEEGAKRFVEETDGWHIPVLQDRDQPIYPRNVALASNEERLIDQLVQATGAPLVRVEQITS